MDIKQLTLYVALTLQCILNNGKICVIVSLFEFAVSKEYAIKPSKKFICISNITLFLGCQLSS